MSREVSAWKGSPPPPTTGTRPPVNTSSATTSFACASRKATRCAALPDRKAAWTKSDSGAPPIASAGAMGRRMGFGAPGAGETWTRSAPNRSRSAIETSAPWGGGAGRRNTGERQGGGGTRPEREGAPRGEPGHHVHAVGHGEPRALGIEHERRAAGVPDVQGHVDRLPRARLGRHRGAAHVLK